MRHRERKWSGTATVLMATVVVAMLFALGFALFGPGFGAAAEAAEGPGVPVVSYIRTWPIGSQPIDMEAGERWSADDIRGELVSTINIAFGLLDGNKIYIKDLTDQPGEVTPGVVVKAFDNLFDEVAAAKAAHPHLKFNLSVGGWGADGFSDMALSAVSRYEFIADALSWIARHNLDGIDIDWEYPVGPPWGGLPIVTRPEDAQTYLLLLSELRTALDALSAELGRPLTLTVAVPASPWFPAAIDVVAVQEQVDYLKLMSYDFYGGWSGQTGHAANLYNNPNDPDGWSTDQAVNAFLNAGILPEKLLMGVPFYARAWSGVDAGDSDGLFQPYDRSEYEDGLNYMDIQARFLTNPSFVRYWDDVAKAAYLYDGDLFITYEDEQSLGHKIDYIREKGLGGIMIWEYGHDLDSELLQALNDHIRRTE